MLEEIYSIIKVLEDTYSTIQVLEEIYLIITVLEEIYSIIKVLEEIYSIYINLSSMSVNSFKHLPTDKDCCGWCSHILIVAHTCRRQALFHRDSDRSRRMAPCSWKDWRCRHRSRGTQGHKGHRQNQKDTGMLEVERDIKGI